MNMNGGLIFLNVISFNRAIVTSVINLNAIYRFNVSQSHVNLSKKSRAFYNEVENGFNWASQLLHFLYSYNGVSCKRRLLLIYSHFLLETNLDSG